MKKTSLDAEHRGMKVSINELLPRDYGQTNPE